MIDAHRLTILGLADEGSFTAAAQRMHSPRRLSPNRSRSWSAKSALASLSEGRGA